MKKSESPIRPAQPRARGVRKTVSSSARAKDVNLTASRNADPLKLLEEHFENSDAYAVKFEYFSPTAREVGVAGSFNRWQGQATPMTNHRNGHWSTEILLQPGRYEYRFVVDGQWQDDPLAERFVANTYGGLNGVVEVKPMTAGTNRRP